MTLSLYDVCMPGLLRTLGAMSAVIDKAQAHCTAKKIDPAVIVNYRLAADMLPFSRQIQIMSDQAKGMGARLTGMEVPSWPDNETTLDDLKGRIAKTVDFLKALKTDSFKGAETRDITLKAGTNEFKFKGLEYASNWVFPNFYFHATTAYDILRHAGVEIGKRDFLGGV
jgi:uncharacterized protein